MITGRSAQIERRICCGTCPSDLAGGGRFCDLQTALGALNTGRGDDHAAMADQVLARSQKGNLLRPRTSVETVYAMERHDLTFSRTAGTENLPGHCAGGAHADGAQG